MGSGAAALGDAAGVTALRSGGAVTDMGEYLSQFEAVYRKHGRRVYTLCLRLLADETAAEEATAQALVRFGREAVRRPGEAPDPTRLRELAIRAALARLRGAEESTETGPPFSPQTHSPADGRAATLDAAALDALDALVARLPQTLRVVFVLRDIEGLVDAAVAARLGRGVADVRRLVGEARLRLLRLRRADPAGS